MIVLEIASQFVVSCVLDEIGWIHIIIDYLVGVILCGIEPAWAIDKQRFLKFARILSAFGI